MDAEAARVLLHKLPHVVDTMQWGDNLVFWAGNKALGGKMFALMPLDGGELVISFAAGAEHAAELLEREGFRPAPYLARLHWVAAERWNVLSARAWQDEFTHAHKVVYDKLPPKVKASLTLPAKEQAALLAERRAALAAKPGKASRRKNGMLKDDALPHA